MRKILGVFEFFFFRKTKENKDGEVRKKGVFGKGVFSEKSIF